MPKAGSEVAASNVANQPSLERRAEQAQARAGDSAWAALRRQDTRLLRPAHAAETGGST